MAQRLIDCRSTTKGSTENNGWSRRIASIIALGSISEKKSSDEEKSPFSVLIDHPELVRSLIERYVVRDIPTIVFSRDIGGKCDELVYEVELCETDIARGWPSSFSSCECGVIGRTVHVQS